LVYNFQDTELTQMQNDIEQQPTPGRNNGKVIAGFILLLIGGGLLLQQISGFLLPYWVFSWGSLFLVIGLYSAAKHNFRKPFSYIFIIIGSLMILDDIFPDVNFQHMFWPILIISVGILMILNRNHKWDHKRFKRDGRNRWNEGQNWTQNQQYAWDKKVNPDNPNEPLVDEPADTTYTSEPKASYGKTYKGYPVEDYLDATSIFGSANKTIFTKTFRGGEIVNIFGGAEIDFTQSDISGQVIIDVTQIFGGIKLLVPPHWHVTSDTVSLFAGFDDKRKQKNLTGDKVLMITGTSIFAGIEIRSY
jgi:predicted membrane protein